MSGAAPLFRRVEQIKKARPGAAATGPRRRRAGCGLGAPRRCVDRLVRPNPLRRVAAPIDGVGAAAGWSFKGNRARDPAPAGKGAAVDRDQLDLTR